jgi:hypothetical protein
MASPRLDIAEALASSATASHALTCEKKADLSGSRNLAFRRMSSEPGLGTYRSTREKGVWLAAATWRWSESGNGIRSRKVDCAERTKRVNELAAMRARDS